MGNIEQAISRHRLNFAFEGERPDQFDMRVVSLNRMVPGSAASCSRAATFAVSPIAVDPIRKLPLIGPKTTGPVWMPIRTGRSMVGILEVADWPLRARWIAMAAK